MTQKPKDDLKDNFEKKYSTMKKLRDKKAQELFNLFYDDLNQLDRKTVREALRNKNLLGF